MERRASLRPPLMRAFVVMAFACTGACAGNVKDDRSGEAGAGGAAGSDHDEGQGGIAGEPNSAGVGGSDSTGKESGGGGAGGRDGGAGATAGSGGAVSAGGRSGGGAGGATDPEPPIPACPDHLYCNGFEDVPLGARPAGGISVTSGNTLAVVDTRASSGARALFVQAASGNASVSVTLDVAEPGRTTYARMMLWMENLPGGDGAGHFSLMGASGIATSPSVEKYLAAVSFGGKANDTQSRLLYLGGGADCDKGVRPQALPLGRWACVELKLDENSPRQYGVKIDGKEIAGLSFAQNAVGGNCFLSGSLKGVWHLPATKTFWFGWRYIHTQVRRVRLWIDDVVLDDKPIGCP